MHTARTIIIAMLSLALLLSIPAAAQTAQPPTTGTGPLVIQPTATDQRTIWDVVKDPENITFLTFLGANLADAKTDWKFTGPITHREYTFTPAQRMSIALGGSAVALYLREQFPRLKRPITVAMGVATAYFAGRALANTYSHGSPGTVTPTPTLTTAGYR